MYDKRLKASVLLRSFNAMKLILALFAASAIIGQGQAHKFEDFGSGPLHEDFQDILDLVPIEEIAEVFARYKSEDIQFQSFLKTLFPEDVDSGVVRQLLIDIEAIPEVIKFLNFLQKEGIEIYKIVNKLNKGLHIKELKPSAVLYSKPITGGVPGFLKDISNLINYNDFTRIYTEKMKTSPAFVRFLQELQSNNTQRIVNKISSLKSFHSILDILRKFGVNIHILTDIGLGSIVPKHLLALTEERSLSEEILDFGKLIPSDKFLDILMQYLTKDEKVQSAIAYLSTPEFHDLLRQVEAIKEHHDLIVFLEKADFHVIEIIQIFHRAIGMEKYVPPKIQSVFESQIGKQKVGEGLNAMLDDLAAIIPTEKIQELYDEKMKTTNAFFKFVKQVTSSEMKKILFNLYGHPTHQKLLIKCLEHGMDLKALSEFYKKVIPIPIPTPVLIA